MTKNTKIKVKNRSFGSVGYTIPDLNNLHREFEFNEQKELTYEELFKLSQVPGGMYIIENYLTIDNEEVVAALLGEVEPEYYYTSEDVTELLTNGSLDQLEDCLNFAPGGVIDLIKEIAVKLPLNDVAKRDLIMLLKLLKLQKKKKLRRLPHLLVKQLLSQREQQSLLHQ